MTQYDDARNLMEALDRFEAVRGGILEGPAYDGPDPQRELILMANEYARAQVGLTQALAGYTPVDPPAPARPLPMIGINGAGAWAERMRQALAATGTKLVRIDMAGSARWKAGWAAEAFPVVRAAGARVVLLVPATQTPSSTFLAFARQWLLPDDLIEYGNETGYADATTVFAAGKSYAGRLNAFINGIRSAGLNHGVLAQGDPAARGSGWNDGMYALWPDIPHAVAGFTVHPYGPEQPTARMDGWNARLRTMVAQHFAHGAPADFPIWITEDGISTDDGRRLGDNYGWDLKMTYGQAGQALADKIVAVKERFPQVAAHLIFQDVDQAWSQYDADDSHVPSTGREGYFGLVRRRTGAPKVEEVVPLAALIAESLGAR